MKMWSDFKNPNIFPFNLEPGVGYVCKVTVKSYSGEIQASFLDCERSTNTELLAWYVATLLI